MSIDREFFNGPITFVCDSCGERDETHCENFAGAHARFKSHGGKTKKIGEDWLHYCKDCGGK